LHGWLDCAASWEPLVQSLAKKQHAARRSTGTQEQPQQEQQKTNRFRLLCVELAGHGKSSHRSGLRASNGIYNLMDFVSDITRLIRDVLALRRCVLVGHSLGGHVATVVSAMIPSHIARLCLIESLGPRPLDDDAAYAATLAMAMASKSRPRSTLTVHKSLEAAALKMSRGFTKTPLAACRVLVRRACVQVECSGGDGGGGYVWRSDPMLVRRARAHWAESMVLSLFAAISANVLFIVASDGFFVSDVWRARLLKRTQTLRRHKEPVILEGGGHHCLMTKPDCVADAMFDLLLPLAVSSSPLCKGKRSSSSSSSPAAKRHKQQHSSE
jgi:pimeloyl-ACP methyl ester carboxylesterase